MLNETENCLTTAQRQTLLIIIGRAIAERENYLAKARTKRQAEQAKRYRTELAEWLEIRRKLVAGIYG